MGASFEPDDEYMLLDRTNTIGKPDYDPAMGLVNRWDTRARRGRSRGPRTVRRRASGR